MKPESKSIQIPVEIQTEKLDEAIEKAKQVVELLTEAHRLIATLGGHDMVEKLIEKSSTVEDISLFI